MKLGRDTASLVNWIQMGLAGLEPVIGMGVTFLRWTDREAGTIVEILPNGYIGVKEDNAVRIDKNGFSEDQVYEYSLKPNAVTRYYRKNKTARWESVKFNTNSKRWKKGGDSPIRLGDRDKYHDFSF